MFNKTNFTIFSLLKKVTASSFIKVFKSGRTNPNLIGCYDNNSDFGEFIIKFKAAKEMYPGANLKEVLSCLLASHLNVNCPEPVGIIVNKEFVNTLESGENKSIAEASLGLNFGCKYIEDVLVFKNEILSTLKKEILETLQKILLFDLFIANPDRTLEHPNLFIKKEKVIAYDHELAYAFLYDFVPNQSIFTSGDRGILEKHILYKSLIGKPLICNEFILKIKSIDENFWNFVKSIIPEEWIEDQLFRIIETLNFKIKNYDAILIEIKKMLHIKQK